MHESSLVIGADVPVPEELWLKSFSDINTYLYRARSLCAGEMGIFGKLWGAGLISLVEWCVLWIRYIVCLGAG